LVWVTRDGREEVVSEDRRQYIEPTVSPNGDRVAVTVQGSAGPYDHDVWIWHARTFTLTRLTFGEGADGGPVWSPDGHEIVFSRLASTFEGPRRDGGLFSVAADGTGQVRQLMKSAGNPSAFDWSTSGHLLYTELVKSVDIMTLTMQRESAKDVLLGEPFDERRLDLSKDGRWLAYESNESGQWEIYVRPFPNVQGGRWLISTGGGEEPKWSADGRQLYYAGNEYMMVSEVETKANFSHRTPTRLFDLRGYYLPPTPRRYDIGPDGRFLMIKEAAGNDESRSRQRIIVVENWVEELKRLVPTK
jgi:eukaryotic-like serine/threonine-protein kinase